jgi:hypothetical protein
MHGSKPTVASPTRYRRWECTWWPSNPVLLGQPVLAWMLFRPAATFAVVVLPWYFIRVPVVVGAEGIRFG